MLPTGSVEQWWTIDDQKRCIRLKSSLRKVNAELYNIAFQNYGKRIELRKLRLGRGEIWQIFRCNALGYYLNQDMHRKLFLFSTPEGAET